MTSGSSSSKKLINEPGSVVTDAIDGFLATHPHLRRLDGFPDIKVTLLSHHSTS
jgi:dihydroxyacetone kinase